VREEVLGCGGEQEGATSTGLFGPREYGIRDRAPVALAALLRQHNDRAEERILTVELKAAEPDGSPGILEREEDAASFP
jgi:hypothetical protein